MTSYTVERIQHAIGKGSFHSGKIEIHKKHFHYIYDCGSINKNLLDEKIRKYLSSINTIDCLFLSHLDYDHVSGIKTIINSDDYKKKFKNTQIILPYLNVNDKFFLLISNIAFDDDNNDSVKEYLEFLENTQDYFNKRILFVRKSYIPPDNPYYLSEDNYNYYDIGNTNPIEDNEFSDNKIIKLRINNNYFINWLLITHVYKKTDDFTIELINKIKCDLKITNIMEVLTLDFIEQNKNKLKQIFIKHF